VLLVMLVSMAQMDNQGKLLDEINLKLDVMKW
jgi:hypothetical protein